MPKPVLSYGMRVFCLLCLRISFLEQGALYLPIHTSPNCPLPSFFTSFRDSRGISHSSCAQGLWGTRDMQGAVSLWHRPSTFSVGGENTGEVNGQFDTKLSAQN